MSSKRTTFNGEWLSDPHFSSWLKAVDHNKHQTRCTVCCKTFELSNICRQAVTSHVKSVSHTKWCTSIVLMRASCECETKMNELAQFLYDNNHISAVAADRCKVQFAALCSHAESDLKTSFTEYSYATERPDIFYRRIIGGNRVF